MSLPHKATIDSGSEQPGRYYSPNPAPIIPGQRERARDTERGGRAEDEVIPNSAHPGSLPHYRGTEIKRGMEQGHGGKLACGRLNVGDAQIGEWRLKPVWQGAQKHTTA